MISIEFFQYSQLKPCNDNSSTSIWPLFLMGTSDQAYIAFEIMKNQILARSTTNYTSVHKHSFHLSNNCIRIARILTKCIYAMSLVCFQFQRVQLQVPDNDLYLVSIPSIICLGIIPYCSFRSNLTAGFHGSMFTGHWFTCQ
jgi:hypothetical protein